MDKFAQRRGILNKLREKANLTGIALEKMNPEFQEMMEKMRATDEKIRTRADGIKDLVRSARSLTRRRDYLSAAVNFSAFHERCRYIAAALKQFESGVNMKHYKFLLDQFDDEQKEQLFGYDLNKEPDLENEADDISFADEIEDADDMVVEASLVKQAGISDWWFKITDPMSDIAHNLTNQRGKAFKALEKRFSVAFLKDLKNSTAIMSDNTERFLSYLLSVFKKLAIALAKRKVDQYIMISKDFISKFAKYHYAFGKYYEKNIVPLKNEHQKLQEAIRLQEEGKSKSLEEGREKSQQMQTSPDHGPEAFLDLPLPNEQDQVLTPAQRAQLQNQLRQQSPAQQTPFRAPVPKPTEYTPSKMYNPDTPEDLTYEDEEAIPLVNKKSHEEFINRLEVLASKNSPMLLAKEILRYSSELEDTDKDTSLRLLSVAEGIIEEYKTAGIFDFLNPSNKPANETEPDKPDQQLEDPDPLTSGPSERPKAIDAGIPEGRVEKRYDSFEFLKRITPDKIRISPAAANHIVQIFMKKLDDSNMDIADFSMAGQKFLTELRKSIYRGWITRNHRSDDPSNPRDRQLEIYVHLNLANIDSSLRGIAKFKVLCRLSIISGALMIRTIDKNFTIEE